MGFSDRFNLSDEVAVESESASESEYDRGYREGLNYAAALLRSERDKHTGGDSRADRAYRACDAVLNELESR